MSVVLPKSRFLHLPKTGGVWVEYTIRACVKDITVLNNPHPHTQLNSTPREDLFTFSFIRHPVDWYRSYWAFKMGRGWDTHKFDKRCGSNDFGKFVENVATKWPGYYTFLSNHFVGVPGEDIDFIGRFEDLAGELRKALTLAGEEVDWTAFDKRTKETSNASNKRWKDNAVVTDEVVAMLSESESELFERFDYKPNEYARKK